MKHISNPGFRLCVLSHSHIYCRVVQLRELGAVQFGGFEYLGMN
jgi:hypothetical protein